MPADLPTFYRFTDGEHKLRFLPARAGEAHSFYHFVNRHFIRRPEVGIGEAPFMNLVCLNGGQGYNANVCPICHYGDRVRAEHGLEACKRFYPTQKSRWNVVDMNMDPALGVQVAELTSFVTRALLQFIDRTAQLALLSPKVGMCVTIRRTRLNTNNFGLERAWDVTFEEPQEPVSLHKLMRYRHNLEELTPYGEPEQYLEARELLLQSSGLTLGEVPLPPIILTETQITERLIGRRKLTL